MKRVYVAQTGDEIDYVIGYVATSLKEAKRWAWAEMRSYCDDYIDMVVIWRKDIKAGGLPLGEIDIIEGLKLGVYTWVDANCPLCGKSETITMSYVFDEPMCEYCEEARLNKEFPLNSKMGTEACWEKHMKRAIENSQEKP